MPWCRSAGSCVGPDVPVPVRRVGRGAGGLEPRVLVGGVVDHQVDDHPDAPVLRLVQQLGEVAEGAEARVDVVEVGDVVAVVAVGRRVDRVQPQAGHARAGPGSRAGRSARGCHRPRRRRSRRTCRCRGSRRRLRSTTCHPCRRNISDSTTAANQPSGGGARRARGGVGYRAGHGERPRTAERTVVDWSRGSGCTRRYASRRARPVSWSSSRRRRATSGGGPATASSTTTARPCWRRCRRAPPWR